MPFGGMLTSMFCVTPLGSYVKSCRFDLDTLNLASTGKLVAWGGRKTCYNLPGQDWMCARRLLQEKTFYFILPFFFIAFTSLLPYSFLFPCLSTGFITSLWRDDAGATMSTCITSDCEGITYLCISCCSTLSVWEHLGLFNCVSFPSFLFLSFPFFFLFITFLPYPFSIYPVPQCVAK